jgi:TPR repeat protein
MNSIIESYIQRESVWPDCFDDRIIDDMIWSEISLSSSAGDFASYLVHRPQHARYIDAARARYERIDHRLDTAPVCYARAIERIRLLAESGDAAAMFHLGKIHSIGIAVEQDFSVAEMWYLRAIDLAEIRAHCNLGWMYQSGFGVSQQQQRAFELLSIGADNGVLAASASVALMLLSGEGCQASPTQGISMLEQAFHDGYNNAANCLADAYFAGKDVAQDTGLGFDWLGQAADRGDHRTMAILGHYLLTGSHGRTDVARGLAYMVSAINRGFRPANLWLGALYEQGLGIECNPHMARLLYQRGVAAGDEECEFALARLSSGAVQPPAPGPASLN